MLPALPDLFESTPEGELVSRSDAKEKLAMAFDLSAAVAAERGDKDASFPFTYKGEDFAIPLAVPVSTIRKLKHVDEDDLDGVLLTLLGEEQGSRFIALDPLDTEIKVLMDEYAKAKGVSLGEASK